MLYIIMPISHAYLLYVNNNVYLEKVPVEKYEEDYTITRYDWRNKCKKMDFVKR